MFDYYVDESGEWDPWISRYEFSNIFQYLIINYSNQLDFLFVELF